MGPLGLRAWGALKDTKTCFFVGHYYKPLLGFLGNLSRLLVPQVRPKPQALRV